MNKEACESFIDFCDDMMIANEGLFKKKNKINVTDQIELVKKIGQGLSNYMGSIGVPCKHEFDEDWMIEYIEPVVGKQEDYKFQWKQGKSYGYKKYGNEMKRLHIFISDRFDEGDLPGLSVEIDLSKES